ncbi:olfactory receptor 11A1-like [Mixophyes fleayi]|uniref:olfactory receptor 11A1-like n=1 Tax=Mixophyes fleayi TaxID=3061075 RepID=UPI003F4D80F4
MEDFNNEQLLSPQNETVISKVLIIGFGAHYRVRLMLFSIFLVTYVVTFSGNFLIILSMFCCKHLQSPMYWFLSNLSLSEIVFTSSITPPMLHVLHTDGATFSIVGCFTQFYMFGSLAVTESFLLSVMSYDRFLAICKPLHYTLIMVPRLCLYLILTCWAGAFLIMSITLCFLCRLRLCGLNIIDHFFCDFAPILKLFCSDTSTVEMVVSLLSSAATLMPFLLIVVTYGCIIGAIANISSSRMKEKAFSTCSSHLGVVSTYYTTMIMVYVVPASHLLVANKVLSLLYTVITPLVNPFIYTLRNQEIKIAIRQILKRKIIKLLIFSITKSHIHDPECATSNLFIKLCKSSVRNVTGSDILNEIMKIRESKKILQPGVINRQSVTRLNVIVCVPDQAQ